jgi:hypothetical protein
MKRAHFSSWFRLFWATMLIALEFTNFLAVITEGGKTQASNSRSPYLFQFATYIVCVGLFITDRSSLGRLVHKPVFKWAIAVFALFTWGMLLRTFYSPAGIPSYEFLRTFGLQVHALAFMLACVVIFDEAKVLSSVKGLVALATILGVGLNLYEIAYPGTFSSVSGRSAGLYVDSNASGMALVLGCLVGLNFLRPQWRESFILLTLLGVLATFSREAMLAIAILVLGASLGRAISIRRLAIIVAAACVVFSLFALGDVIGKTESWNLSNIQRLRFATGDDSAQDRLRLGRKVLEEFEKAPLFGQGFGTDQYWGDTASHDFFLDMLANYGVIGVFIIPGLVLCVRRKSWDSNTFSLLFLTW